MALWDVLLLLGAAKPPSMGLRQGCPLSATLFGLFIDGLHHYFGTAVPTAGIQILQMRLRELVYADDIVSWLPRRNNYNY